jgi:hypothetical protein
VIIDIISCLKVISENTENLRKLETINVNLSEEDSIKIDMERLSGLILVI